MKESCSPAPSPHHQSHLHATVHFIRQPLPVNSSGPALALSGTAAAWLVLNTVTDTCEAGTAFQGDQLYAILCRVRDWVFVCYRRNVCAPQNSDVEIQIPV